jgi:transcriptional regulator with GAF, ATPase, and Fis domain
LSTQAKMLRVLQERSFHKMQNLGIERPTSETYEH